MTIKVGVIGLGVGEAHIRGYQAENDVTVEAICDIDPDRLELIANRYTISQKTLDWREITDNPNIDAISICSYDNYHAEQCIRAFKNGKHLMVEKPIVLHKEEAEQVLRAQQDSGKLITSNLILRQSPRFLEVKQQVQNGEFGEIFAIEGDYIHDILHKIVTGWRGKMDFYCTIFGGGIHLIDLMRWVIGQEIIEVSGMGNKILTRNSEYKYDDTFMNLFRFENGALGKCLSTYGPRRTKFHNLNVFGTEKTFSNDIPYGKLFTGDQPENESKVETSYPGMEKGDLLGDFLSAIRFNKEPIVNAKDVFRVMDVCFAALEAVEKRKTIKIDYLI